MTSGTVKFYNDQKGFGFIQPDDGGTDVFVHATALERAGMRALSEGQKVSVRTFPVVSDWPSPKGGGLFDSGGCDNSAIRGVLTAG